MNVLFLVHFHHISSLGFFNIQLHLSLPVLMHIAGFFLTFSHLVHAQKFTFTQDYCTQITPFFFPNFLVADFNVKIHIWD